MEKERILREAQKIASKFSFWMVSGNISHLYGYVYETPDIKYELEIKFDEDFPDNPPQLIYHDEIKDLMGEIQLNKYLNWTPDSHVVDIIEELKLRIQEALNTQKTSKEHIFPLSTKEIDVTPETDDYITPDLDAYPPDFQPEEYITPSYSNDDDFYTKHTNSITPENNGSFQAEKHSPEIEQPFVEPIIIDDDQTSLAITTELGLIQQEYAYDQMGSNPANIQIYITITLSKTFIISIDFSEYPDKPAISVQEEIQAIIGDPNSSIEVLKNWDKKKPKHIVDILHELEKKLLFIKEIESQYKIISGEYQCDKIQNKLTTLKVHLLTYGFQEFSLDFDLELYPKPPIIKLSPELQQILNIPITELTSYKNWRESESDAIEIIREISWLVDKNSRINFEIDLLKDHYKNIKYEPSTTTLNVEMKGKMKTEDLTFEFQIKLPIEYPMKVPEIKVVNEFELEAHEKIKNDLHSSFDDFFDEWTPFRYLIDLFNQISKKIFEVSVVSCVICHKIECPSCSKKIAGDESCHAECPHCNRVYHRHCWEQTIHSFGKCGFCLR
ncbi:MAG: hypothetical protein ACFFD7_05140 [Candidatus Thorarchaeota archaeon]